MKRKTKSERTTAAWRELVARFGLPSGPNWLERMERGERGRRRKTKNRTWAKGGTLAWQSLDKVVADGADHNDNRTD